MNRTLYSATLSIEGEGCKKMVDEWQGTLKWISQSPYKIHHQRKNWLVGINVFTVRNKKDANTKNFSYQSLRASEPGGQHVNKTKSVVRETHIPSGLSVLASDQHSHCRIKSCPPNAC